MANEYGRDLRIADFIRKEVADIVQRQMRDPRVGMLSVNEVTVSKDLSYSEVYVSSLDTTDAEERVELMKVLNKAAGFVRSELARRHSMRTTPKLRFHYDELAESGPRLERLIEEIVRNDEARHVSDEIQSTAGEDKPAPENESGDETNG